MLVSIFQVVLVRNLVFDHLGYLTLSEVSSFLVKLIRCPCQCILGITSDALSEILSYL